MGRPKDKFNEYKIEGDICTIYLKKRNGEIFETYIDTKELNKIKDLDLHWGVNWLPNSKSYYAAATKHLGKINGREKIKTIYLHRAIMNFEGNKYIDHINHNTLDNRKSNLRITEGRQNTKNRKSKNSNNTSGCRNVSKVGNWWYVQLQINGKNTLLKKFPLDQLDEAGKYATEMRNTYYGEFAGET